MISTTTLTIEVTNKVGRLTDTTDYASLGISVASFVAKGLGSIYFQGNLIESGTTVGDPLIDLAVGDTFFEFPLELDLNGNVANGIYAVDYSLRIDTSAFNLGIEGITLPSTLEINGGSSGWLADFLEAGDQITLYNPVPSLTQQVVTVATVNLVDPGLPTAMVVITTNEVITTDTWPFWSVSITNPQSSTTYTYAGCTQTTADVNFVYDCEVGDNGSWSVSNATSLATNEVIDSLNCTINYPSWTTLSPTFPGNVVLTSLPYPSAPGTETPLATGTYSVSLSQQIQQLQTDGLIIVYSTTVVKEFVVSCAGSLCGLTPCIENLRVAHANELQRNRISKYQVFVDNVLLYYAEAQTYKACGDMENYRATIALIRANLDSSGCECACCDDETYFWVSNNSGVSVIDGLIEAFQFRLFALTPPGPGSPLITDDVTKGVQVGAIWQNTNTGILYRCTVNTEGNATWVEYYTPGLSPTASDVPANPGSILTGPDVQAQLDQVDTLAVFDGINGLTKVGNDVVLGGSLSADTIIDCNSGKLTLLGASEVFEIYSVGNQAATITVERAVTSTPANNIYIETTTTAGAGANGIGSSILMRSQNAAGSIEDTSKIISTWVDATAQSSNIRFTTKLAGVESTGITINPDSSITLNEYNGPNFEDASPAYLLGVDASGNVVQAPSNALVYAGRTRFSAGAIQIAEYGNTTGATISISNTGVGVYTITASSAVFTANTTAFVQLQGVGFATTSVATSSTITIRTYDITGVASDATIATGSLVKIEIYP